MTHPSVKPFIPFFETLAAMLGANYEIALHDFSDSAHSIIKIANGHITGREVGAPATDLILAHAGKPTQVDKIIGYRTKAKNGAELRSSTVFIKDAKGRVVGALCINCDVTPYLSMWQGLEELRPQLATQGTDNKTDPPETFESNVSKLIEGLMDQTIAAIGRPIPHMSREDKVQAIHELKQRGVFKMRGSARRVSRKLNVSLATVYKYLQELDEAGAGGPGSHGGVPGKSKAPAPPSSRRRK
jgi:predicted transcriptional regulator YheO